MNLNYSLSDLKQNSISLQNIYVDKNEFNLRDNNSYGININNTDNQVLYNDFDSFENMSLSNTSEEYPFDNYSPILYPDLTQISFVRVLFLIFYSLVMFLAIFGNSVVCYTVISNRKMQTVVNCYIVNLAICDFLVGAFVLPVKFLELMAPAHWYVFSDGLCTVMLYLQTVVVFSSVLTLVAICLERYFAIIHPLKSRINKSKSRTFKIIFMTYLIPSLGSLPFLFPTSGAVEYTLYSDYGTISRLTCFINFDPQFRKFYYTFIFIFFYLIPLAFIVYTCTNIARSLLKITGLNRQGSLRRQEVNRRKIGQMILIVVIAYTISWTPYFIVSIITQYQEVNFMQKHNFYFTMLCINLFAFLNSSINPFIYAIMSTRFRNGFLRILRLFFCISDTKSQDIVESIPSRRMSKPLSCLNKYHRQMLLFACGNPSQLSTDSSTQHNESSYENIFVASFRFNKISFRRRTSSPSNSISNTKNKILRNRLQKKSSFDSKSLKCELLNTHPIGMVKKRTGSESKLPGLKKIWEENFIGSDECKDTKPKISSTYYQKFCSKSLPDLPNILYKDLKTVEIV